MSWLSSVSSLCESEFATCLYCKEPHQALDKTLCKEYEKQKQIKQKMADLNISYIEATNIYKNSFASVINTLNVNNTLEFPPLNYKPSAEFSSHKHVDDTMSATQYDTMNVNTDSNILEKLV